MSSSQAPTSSSGPEGPAVPRTPWQSPRTSEGEDSTVGRVEEASSPSSSHDNSNFSSEASPPRRVLLPIRPTPPAATRTSRPAVQTSDAATQTSLPPSPTTPQPVQNPPQPFYAADVLAQIADIPTFDTPTLDIPTLAPATLAPSMLRVSAIKSLFQENLTEDAKAIFLTTTHGTLLGASPALTPALYRKACALGGLTWRVASAILAGQDPAALTTTKPLTTLASKTKHEGRALATLVVEFEAAVLAFAHMKENLLVGVLGATCVGEGGVGEEQGKAGEGDGGEGEGGEEAMGEGSGGEAAGEVEGGGGGGAGARDGEEGEAAWKGAADQAEAMAAYLRVEMKDFSMPSGFE